MRAVANVSLAAWATCAALAGCGPGATVERAAIIGGTADPGDPAVALLVAYDASTFDTCTAALIAPSLLVTAAHCVDGAHHAGKTFGVFFGADATPWAGTPQFPSHLAAVAVVHAHPQYDPAPPFTADIGAVVLAADAAAAPLPIAFDAPMPSLVGTAARLVGFGQTTYGTPNNAKYTVTTTVAAIDAGDTLTVGDASHHSCVGDSGGPALGDVGGRETVLAVDSYTDTSGCTQAAHYRRIDLYLDFLRQYAPLAPPDLGAPPDLSAPPDLAGRADGAAAPDLRAAPRDLAVGSAAADLSAAITDATPHAAAAPGGGCQAAPGVPGGALAILLALALRRRRS